jgi:hypothetical protein
MIPSSCRRKMAAAAQAGHDPSSIFPKAISKCAAVIVRRDFGQREADQFGQRQRVR